MQIKGGGDGSLQHAPDSSTAQPLSLLRPAKWLEKVQGDPQAIRQTRLPTHTHTSSCSVHSISTVTLAPTMGNRIGQKMRVIINTSLSKETTKRPESFWDSLKSKKIIGLSLMSKQQTSFWHNIFMVDGYIDLVENYGIALEREHSPLEKPYW